MIISNIIEQHWEETALLWAQRAQAAGKASCSLQSLSALDGRIEAHLDGLRVAGAEGWELCRRAAGWDDPGEAFAAGVLAFETSDESRMGGIRSHLNANPALARGLASALGWLDAAAAQPHLKRLLAAGPPLERQVGLAGAVAHRLRLDGSLAAALDDADESLRARAGRAAGELGRVDLAGKLQANLATGAGPVAFWAAWSLAILSGDAGACRRLREFLVPECPWQGHAAQVLFRRLDFGGATEYQRRLAKEPGQLRLAIIAAGIVGDPATVPWLLDQMENPETSRLAADAFQTITGADFVRDRLRRNSPPRPPVAEDAGEDQPADPDEDLTWPEPAAIRRWWEQHRGGSAPGARFLLGKSMTIEWLREVLVSGQQPQRRAAALELAIRQPGTPLFNVKAPGFRQQRLLEKAETANP